jgi:K+-sensing histidine kinase KdpD
VTVLLRGALAEANLVLIYLLSVVAATFRFGRGPGILASFLAVLAFDVFLVEPIHSFEVADPQYLLTFAIMLTVSLIVSHLTANLRRQAQIAEARARRANVQYGLSKDLASAITVDQIREIVAMHLATAFHGTGNILIANPGGALDCSPLNSAPGIAHGSASAMAQAVFERKRGDLETDAVSAVGQLHFIPLRAPMRVRGVLVLFNGDCRTPEQVRLLQAFAAQLALAIERVHYVDVARGTAMEMESERLRNSLLSAVSHDVRTPLAAIVGLSSTLATMTDLAPETVRELAQAIGDDAVRMNDLVTNLLDLARLQTGGPHLNREWQMIEEVIGSALAASRRALGAMEIGLSLPAQLPLIAYDAVLLERVLCNLLENAARHAAGGMWIGISATLTAAELWISVTDRGPGVVQGNEERIFAKFAHGSSLPSRDGVGLGLAICRTIVEAHGGKIWVESGPNGGARFIFTLPLGTPPDISSMNFGEPQ